MLAQANVRLIWVLIILSGCRVSSPDRLPQSEQAVVWDAAVAIYNEDRAAFRGLLDPEMQTYGHEDFHTPYVELRKEIKQSELEAWDIEFVKEGAEPYLVDHYDGSKLDLTSGVAKTKTYEVSITPRGGTATPIAAVTVIYSPKDKTYRIRRIRLIN